MRIQPVTVEIDGIEYELPTCFEVCPKCEGRGTHVNDAIDGNGITQDEMAELGPEFCEDYMSGVYDVACTRCGGRNVVPVVDEARCEPALLAAYQKAQQEESDYRSICAMERRMGA